MPRWKSCAGGDDLSRVHIALLRGVNLVRSKRVAMADLRTLVTDLGYLRVRTLLNSGNVVFTVPPGKGGKPAARIEEAITRKLGFSSRVTVLRAAELQLILEENRLGGIADNPSKLLVSVLTNPADRSKLLPLTREDWGVEAFAVGSRAAYLWCAEGIHASPLAQRVGRVLGDAVTSRNWSTLNKLHALAGSAS